jgi:uncharacterized protein YndB with AHSA1/START domain
MRTRLLTLAIAALLALSALPASASGTLTGSATSQGGGRATVSGVASIPAPTGAFSVGGTLTNFAGSATPAGAVVQLTGAEVELLEDGVRFTWKVTDIPDVVPPEGVRYTWGFSAGGQQFQLQAKRLNLASITTAEDPVGHVEQAAAQRDFFQLRGACQAMYRGLPTSGCFHLAFLQGSFDTAKNTVTMTVPFRTTDSIGRVVADAFRRGAEITASESAGMSIAGGFQAVVSNTQTSSFINGWTSFFTGPTVQLGVGRPGANANAVTYSSTATFDPATGAFSGTVEGLTTQNSAVFARVCHGLKTACVAAQLPMGQS